MCPHWCRSGTGGCSRRRLRSTEAARSAAVDDVDYTGGKTLAELVDQLAKRGIVFAIVDASPDLRRELDRFGVTAKIGEEHYYDSLQAVRDAFHRAVQTPQ